MLTLRVFLFVFAIACFLFSAFAPPTRLNPVALGLACWLLATLL